VTNVKCLDLISVQRQSKEPVGSRRLSDSEVQAIEPGQLQRKSTTKRRTPATRYEQHMAASGLQIKWGGPQN